MTKKLAIHGGTPVRNKLLPYGKQWVGEDDFKAVLNVLKSDYLTTGPMVNEFEQHIAEYVGAKYAVTFTNGTTALHGACFAAGVTDQDEVITTPMTFVASANCVLYQGGKPVFADIDPLTWNIDPNVIEKQITNKTKAIIPVDFTGRPADLDRILAIAKKHQLVVIEDAAHAIGAVYKGQKVGSISDMTMFSFHPVKHITTGEGGVITTNHKEYYDKLIQFRSHGITRDLSKLQHNEGSWYYEMQCLGNNYRMTDIQAALGISQLTKLNEFIERRKQIVNVYNEAFKHIEQLELPYATDSKVNSSWHLYIIRLQLSKLKAGRREIFEALQAENIGVNVHYIPVYMQPYYQELGYAKGICPQAEQLYEQIITLPLFPAMTEGDIQDVIDAVGKVIEYYAV